jgi:hypothetical protein
MGRVVGRLAVAVLLVALAGCTEPVELRAFVDPPTGHVPYAAHIVCSALPGTYTYELPDGTSVTTRDSELAFTVDRLEWSARIVVTVEDDWGRRTTATLEIPVGAIPNFSFYDEFEDDLFFVSRTSGPY